MGLCSWEELIFLFRFIFKEIFLNFLLGLKDSLYGIYSIFNYDKPGSADSKNISRDSYKYKTKKDASQRDLAPKKEKEFNVRYEVFRCATFNLCTYAVSIGIAQSFLYLLNLILYFAFTEDTAFFVYTYTHWMFSTLFDIFWMVPLYFIFKCVNAFWFQDIAVWAFKRHYGKPRTFPIAEQISDNLFAFIIEMMVLGQILLTSFVPSYSLSFLLRCIQYSLLNSLYSFEYLWCNKGWTFQRRINYIEENWPYFLGFGLPLSIVALYIQSTVASSFIFSFCFPFYIISSIEASPPLQENPVPKVRVFALVMWISSFVTNILVKKNKRMESVAR